MGCPVICYCHILTLLPNKVILEGSVCWHGLQEPRRKVKYKKAFFLTVYSPSLLCTH